jgi:hypothetical protein
MWNVSSGYWTWLLTLIMLLEKWQKKMSSKHDRQLKRRAIRRATKNTDIDVGPKENGKFMKSGYGSGVTTSEFPKREDTVWQPKPKTLN